MYFIEILSSIESTFRPILLLKSLIIRKIIFLRKSYYYFLHIPDVAIKPNIKNSKTFAGSGTVFNAK